MNRDAGAAETACDVCALSRRHFLGAATVTALATLIEACSDLNGPGGLGGGGTVSGGAFTVKLTDFPALGSVGGVARVSPGGSPVALVRTGAATFLAVSMVCTHQGTTVNIVSGGYFCPNHGAQYSTNGTWIGGQRTSSLPTFSTTYDAQAGTVAISRP